MFLSRFGVGQNLYIYKQSLRRASTDWERAIEDWYDEVRLFSYKKVSWVRSFVCLMYHFNASFNTPLCLAFHRSRKCSSPAQAEPTLLSFFWLFQVEPFQFSAAIGHFSQLVWADTDKECISPSVSTFGIFCCERSSRRDLVPNSVCINLFQTNKIASMVVKRLKAEQGYAYSMIQLCFDYASNIL